MEIDKISDKKLLHYIISFSLALSIVAGFYSYIESGMSILESLAMSLIFFCLSCFALISGFMK